MESGYQLGNEPVVALVIILELVFGLFYAWFVDWLKREGRERGYAAFLVVGGNFFTIVLTIPIIGIMGALVILTAFVLTGLPMILVTTYRHTEDARHQRQADRAVIDEFQRDAQMIHQILEKLAHLEQQLNGEDDGHTL